MGQRSGNVRSSIDRIDDQHKFGLSIDVAILGFDNSSLKVCVKNCDMPAYLDQPALLGGLVNQNELLYEAAARVLKKHIGLENISLIQVGAFDKLDRHPVDRVITVAFFSVVKIADCNLWPTPEGNERWSEIDDLPEMAFDHRSILTESVRRLRNNVNEAIRAFKLLPDQFTLSELQQLHEVLLNRSLDKRNFRKKALNTGLIESSGQYQKDVSHRPAKLFQLTSEE